jgi:hypothetical protein
MKRSHGKPCWVAGSPAASACALFAPQPAHAQLRITIAGDPRVSPDASWPATTPRRTAGTRRPHHNTAPHWWHPTASPQRRAWPGRGANKAQAPAVDGLAAQRRLRRDRCTPVEAFIQQGESPCRGKPEPRSRKKLRRREAGWGATGGELAVRRVTNSIRRGVVASLQRHGEAWNASQALVWRPKRLADHQRDWRRNVRKDERDKRGDLRAGVTARRSQSPRSTEVAARRREARAT